MTPETVSTSWIYKATVFVYKLTLQLKVWFTESWNGLGWKGPQWSLSFNPLLCARLPTSRPGSPEPHPAWPHMPPGIEHPQPTWATCSSASPPSEWFLPVGPVLHSGRHCTSGTSTLGCRQAPRLAFPKLLVLVGSYFARSCLLGGSVRCFSVTPRVH